MAASVRYLTYVVFLWCLHLAKVMPYENEAWVDGPRGLKLFVGRKGGTIRLYRELQPPLYIDEPERNGDKKLPPARSGEISLSFGRIQEVDSSSNPISGYHGVRDPNNIDFAVTHHE